MESEKFDVSPTIIHNLFCLPQFFYLGAHGVTSEVWSPSLRRLQLEGVAPMSYATSALPCRM